MSEVILFVVGIMHEFLNRRYKCVSVILEVKVRKAFSRQKQLIGKSYGNCKAVDGIDFTYKLRRSIGTGRRADAVIHHRRTILRLLDPTEGENTIRRQ